jgi:hypothetical protein
MPRSSLARAPWFVLVLPSVMFASAHATGIRMDRDAWGSAGGTVSATAMRVILTVGQLAAGPSSASGFFEVAGFWQGYAPSVLDVGAPEAAQAATFALGLGTPNPFSRQTSFSISVPPGHGTTPVVIRLYDVTGRSVRALGKGPLTPGTHVLEWDGRDDAGAPLRSGVYFCRVDAATFHATRRLVLIR